MGDTNIDSGTSGDVTGAAGLLLEVGTEEAGVMAFLNHNEGNARLVVRFKFNTGLADGCELVLEDLKNYNITYQLTCRINLSKRLNGIFWIT